MADFDRDLDAPFDGLSDGFERALEPARALSQRLRSVRLELDGTSRLGLRFGNTLVRAFEGLIGRGKSLGDTLRSVALSFSRIALSAAFKPLEQGIASIFSSAFAGARAFASGGAMQRTLPVPFAAGGIITSPVLFPLRGGGTGLAGESGAEAIMPLARGPDGRLGVMANGQGNVTITFNVTTPDAESFRRSETQLAAMLSRTVSRGQRNL
jgi:phage-related minor tail protein